MISIFLLIFIDIISLRKAERYQQRCLEKSDSHAGIHLDCSYRKFRQISPFPRIGALEYEFIPNMISGNLLSLNFTGNELTSINSNSFALLKNPELLRALDLSHNQISTIDRLAFKSLENLKFLYLNSNQLLTINRPALVNLVNLQYLNLDDNFFSSFTGRAISSLVNLKYISIRSNQLMCNCDLKDFVGYINKKTTLGVSDETICTFPKVLRNQRLTTLKTKLLKPSCDKSNLSTIYFSLSPSTRSVITYVHEENRIKCITSNMKGISMEWLKNNVPFTDTHRIFTNTSVEANNRLYTLTFNPVLWEDEGEWTCSIEVGQFSIRNSIRLLPISANTELCIQDWQANEKGELVWPLSEAGLVSLPCPNGLNAKIYRQCKRGKWSEILSHECEFASALTKQLTTLLNSQEKFMYMQKFLDILSALSSSVSDISLSAYETRLSGWVVGNATDFSSLQLLMVVSILSNSNYIRSEIDESMLRNRLQALRLSDTATYLRNIAACQLMVGSAFDKIDLNDKYNIGFLAAYDATGYKCEKRNSVELVKADGMTSIRIPWQTVEFFSSTVFLRTLWLKTANMFSSIYSADSKWRIASEIQAIAIEKFAVDFFPANTSSVKKTDFTPSSSIYFTFLVSTSLGNHRLAIYGNKHWKLIDEKHCILKHAGPSTVFVSCFSDFLPLILKDSFTYLALMKFGLNMDRLIEVPWFIYTASGFFSATFLALAIVYITETRLKIFPVYIHAIINIYTSMSILSIAFIFSLNAICQAQSYFKYTIQYFYLATVFWKMIAMRSLLDVTEQIDSDMQQRNNNTTIRIETVRQTNAKLVLNYSIGHIIPLFSITFGINIDSNLNFHSATKCFPSFIYNWQYDSFNLLFPLTIALLLTAIFSIKFMKKLTKIGVRYSNQYSNISVYASREIDQGVHLNTVDEHFVKNSRKYFVEFLHRQFKHLSFTILFFHLISLIAAIYAYCLTRTGLLSSIPWILSLIFSLSSCIFVIVSIYLHSSFTMLIHKQCNYSS